MRFLWRLLWFLLAVAVIALAMYLTGNYELTDRLTAVFLNMQSSLPVSLSLEQFLVVLAVAGLLVAGLAVFGFLGVLVRLGMSRHTRLRRLAAVQQEADRIHAQHEAQNAHLLALAQALTKQLDRRVLIQTIVEAASRMTSMPQANSVVSFWLLHFETDTIRFERGLYCDETIFTKTTFQPTEPPFGRVVSTRQLWLSPSWSEGLSLVKREKASRLGSATAMMAVPLVIEGSVLGVLVLFCHPDLLKTYEQQRSFYEAMWGEFTLALAVAIQGEIAILDRLTGTQNREYFMKRLIQEIERANRYQLSLSLLMIDIDNFKLVNDMFGHPQGDAVLKIIAKIIKSAVRAIDLVGRYGGEEFIVMLPETGPGETVAKETGAAVVAERIRQAVDDEFRGMQKPLNLTISIGVAGRRYPEDRAGDHRELIRLADEQLYRAKTSGKNKVCVFQPDQIQPVS